MKTRTKVVVLTSVLTGAGILAILACSNSSNRPPTSGDSDSGAALQDVVNSSASDVVRIPSTDAAVCVGSPNEAPVVVVQRTGNPPPTPKGGKIVPGKYYLTAITDYTGIGAPVPIDNFEQITLYVTDTTIEYSEREGKLVDGSPNTLDQEDKGVAYTTSGNQIVARNLCPVAGGDSSRGYTFENDQLSYFASPQLVRVYTRQP